MAQVVVEPDDFSGRRHDLGRLSQGDTRDL
jgi:hypothetical protein